VTTILTMLLVMMLFNVILVTAYYNTLVCKIDADECKPLGEMTLNSYLFRVATFLALLWCFFNAWRFALESRPAKYRSSMNARIARIRALVREPR
jgi:hypothetical protein